MRHEQSTERLRSNPPVHVAERVSPLCRALQGQECRLAGSITASAPNSPSALRYSLTIYLATRDRRKHAERTAVFELPVRVRFLGTVDQHQMGGASGNTELLEHVGNGGTRWHVHAGARSAGAGGQISPQARKQSNLDIQCVSSVRKSLSGPRACFSPSVSAQMLSPRPARSSHLEQFPRGLMNQPKYAEIVAGIPEHDPKASAIAREASEVRSLRGGPCGV